MQNIATISRKRYTLCKKFRYSKLFRFPFSRICAKYGEILRISPYSVRMRENADQNNSKCGNFLRSHKSHIWFHIFLFWSHLGKKRTINKIEYAVVNNFHFPLLSGRKWEKKLINWFLRKIYTCKIYLYWYRVMKLFLPKQIDGTF